MKKFRLDDEGHKEPADETPSPAGFSRREFQLAEVKASAAALEQHMAVSAMQAAKAPLQQIISTGMMMWLSGNSLQIFSIMALVMMFRAPVTGLLSVRSSFARFEGKTPLLLPYLTFVAINLLLLGMGLYKASAMGLLPSWAELTAPTPLVRAPLEVTGGGVLGA